MRGIKKSVLFLATVAVIALGLRLLGWLPLAIEKDAVQSYKSLDEVREKLRPSVIYQPAYFPEYLRWPPDEIYAGRRPSFSLLMQFAHRKTGQIVLAVGQSTSESGISSKIEPERVLKEEVLSIKGRPARLYLALCKDGEPCNKVVLKDGGFVLTVTVKDAVSEAVKTAESMLP